MLNHHLISSLTLTLRREAELHHYTSGVHYFSNNSTDRSELFRLYYGCHTSTHRSDDIFQGIRSVILLAIERRTISSASHPTTPLLIPKRHFKP